ncbi:MAG: ABC transporter permease [bacterium]
MRHAIQRIRCLLRKEIAQTLRDRRLLGILIVAPFVQLIVLGYAATTEVKEIALAIRDNDHSFHSREFARALGASGYFKTIRIPDSGADDGESMVSGRAGLVITIPTGFGAHLVRNEPSPVQVLVDGADSSFAVIGLNYMSKAVRQYSSELVKRQMAGRIDLNVGGFGAMPEGGQASLPGRQVPAGLELPSMTVETRVWYNPELTSKFYMVPGVMGVLLLVTTMIVSAMALVKEREQGTMEQIIVTPLRSGELLAGKLLPFVVIGFMEITLALPVILFIFGVPLRGSLLLLYALSGLFLLTTIGLGLLVSTFARTQQQAMLVSAFFIMMPFVLLSGFIFPAENMPAAIRFVSHFLPLKYYLTIIRGIFLKGAGLVELWQDALALLLIGVGIFTLAAARFHRRLE